MAFTRDWDVAYEGTPADGSLAKLLGQRIRDLKLDIRERLELEHSFGDANDLGRHKFPRGNQAARDALTDMVNGTVFIRTDRPGYDVYTGSAWGEHWLTVATTTAAAAAWTDVPTGYRYYDTDDSEWKQWDGSAFVSAVGVLVGQRTMWHSATPPGGWLLCDGQAVSRTTYAALFAVIGTIYGIGDGSTTFNLPNYTGRFVVGVDTGDADFDGDGNGIDAVASVGGKKTHTHGSSAGPPNDFDISAALGQTDPANHVAPFIAEYWIIKT